MNLRNILIAVLIASSLGSCVPSPNSSEDAFPQFTLLSTFYAPRDTATVYVWHDSSVALLTSSTIFHRYLGERASNFAAPYTHAAHYEITDSATGSVTSTDAIVTDTVVIESLQLNGSVNAVARLSGLLSVGTKWVACAQLTTSNASVVTVSATVDNYFSSTSVGAKSYSNVYHVTYQVTDVVGPGVPVEPEYQNGATLGVYYAKSVGPTYMVWKDASGRTLRIAQLAETRPR
ncbi:MAG: hypothetical protein JSS75_12965 [Bacteroidetes bacterium]|nr:hypothetical protein [Bacteroidota bacterium]